LRECKFHFWSLRWVSSNWQWRRSMILDLIVFIQWFLWWLCRLLRCLKLQHEQEFNECKFLDRNVSFFELKSAASIDRIVSWDSEWRELRSDNSRK
jgi:hypothetical protein